MNLSIFMGNEGKTRLVFDFPIVTICENQYYSL